ARTGWSKRARLQSYQEESAMSMGRMAMTVVFMLGSTLLPALPASAQQLQGENFKGQVFGGGAPIAKSTVTLWEASAGAPKQVAQTKTDDDGRFDIRSKEADSDSILYLIAAGGEAKSKPGSTDNPAIVLLSVLGNRTPDKVVVNELTTVASVFTAARF